jgi:hypothetical protein
MMTFDDKTKEQIHSAARSLATEGGQKLATRVGEQVVRGAVEQTYKAAVTHALTTGAANPGMQALATTAVKTVGTRSAAQAAVPIAGKAAGALAAPVVEVALMYIDDNEYTGREYARAAGQATVAGIAGMVASGASATTVGLACAAVGSVVPGLGTAVGFAVGAATSYFVNKRLKEM